MRYKVLYLLPVIAWASCLHVEAHDKVTNFIELKRSIVAKYKDEPAGAFVMPSNHVLNTQEKVVALTFDACGGRCGSGYNKEVIEYLISENVSATLFISGKWIDANKGIFDKLGKNSLFEIENHGLNHKVASINGKSIYNIRGTTNIDELVDEVELNAEKIRRLTGKKPRFYRGATGWYDEAAIKIIRALGYQIVNGNCFASDYNENVSANQIYKNILMTKNPSIIILHMNHPHGKEKGALMLLVPEFRMKGYRFVKLSDYGVIEK